MRKKLRITQLEQENKILSAQVLDLSNKLQTTLQDYSEIETKVKLKRNEYFELDNKIQSAQEEYNNLLKKNDILSETILFYSAGLFELKFNFNDSEKYKSAIKENRQKQKEMVKNSTAIKRPLYGTLCVSSQNGYYDNDEHIGQRLLDFLCNSILISFNAHCDNILSNITPIMRKKASEEILHIYNHLNAQTALFSISISQEYYQLKLEQVDLTIDNEIFKQQQKEEQRRQREIIKEQELAEKEIEKDKAKLLKERKHYEQQLALTVPTEIKHEEISNKIADIDNMLANDDYRLANQKCGWVYILSNPSFGENVVKIGTTRRLDAYDRINELSNASVPYKFVPNAIIFSEDAFALESDLHKEFTAYRVNKANMRKEYFNLPIEEIAKTIKEKYCADIMFNYAPVNEEYIYSQNQINS